MVTFVLALLAYGRTFLMGRHRLARETTALRQQLAVYKRKQPRPSLNRCDRLFWVMFRCVWNHWLEAVILVKPDTAVSWHRAGYRLFWKCRLPYGPASQVRFVGSPCNACNVDVLPLLISQVSH
jgi:putative transposase